MWKNKKQQLPSPMVVTTDCSRFGSCLFLRGRIQPFHPLPHHPLPSRSMSQKSSSPSSKPTPVGAKLPACNSKPSLPPPHHQLRDRRSVAKMYRERIHQLEQELVALEKWLETEKSLLDHLKNCRGNTKTDDSQVKSELLRLADGTYLRGVIQLGRRSQSLVMHVSAPVIAETGSTAFEVMLNMASMGMEDLIDCLTKAMPMDDISGYKMDQIKGKRLITSGLDTGFMEKIILEAVEEMECLAMEGLEFQASENPMMMEEEVLGCRDKNNSRHHESIVLVMLIQIRDKMQDHEAVGDPMICFVEVYAGEKVGRRSNVEGAHIAGLKCISGGSYKDGFIWSISTKGYYGRLDSCCHKYVRNDSIAFTRK